MAASGCQLFFTPVLYLTILLLVVVNDGNVVSARQVRMRMVEEPINTGQNYDNNNEPESLQPKVKPSNFSGPPHLKRLYGRCFSKIIDSYKYEFCPFQNVTQHEQSLRWNPYSGVLGVWQEWSIERNTFKKMLMKEGDECGEKNRQVSVQLACGALNSIVNVSEPSTCEYAMVFNTPLVCHKHSLLVYPTLPGSLQSRWDEIEGELFNEEITQQGYKKKLDKIFQEAGLIMDPVKKEPHKHPEKSNTHDGPQGDHFDSLESCSVAYQALQDEIKRLKAQLEQQGKDGENGPLFNLDNIYT
ncbi:N-acetylglucosamine-1-phosphotransferase subunit gamma-like [Asterias amurensis]|uniref:N-acetylglucosamine-1-phosphotransferase subunit gamma-like n=1 Tax=Asterias amurensis TaxID=7602 RepID=UPI003AB839D5